MRKSDYEARFKKVAGGFLFQAPNPWLFAPGEHYLVSEAQQAEILNSGEITIRWYGWLCLFCFSSDAPSALSTLSLFSSQMQIQTF